MTAMPGSSHSGPLPALTDEQRALAARLRGHVETLARSERNTDLDTAARYIADALRAHGLDPKLQSYPSGGRSVSNVEVSAPGNSLVIVGAAKGDWIAPLMGMIKATIVQPFVDQKLSSFIAQLNHDDMKFLGELMQTGKLTPVIDRRYPLGEAAQAMEYLEAGRARGKVIVSLE